MNEPGDAGFTLVELLIVVLLLGVITAIVTGAVSFGVRSWEATSEHEAAVARIEAVQRFLRQQLRDALYVDGANGVVGTTEEVTFVAVLPAHLGTGGSHRFRVRAATVDDAPSFVVEWQPFRHNTKPTDWQSSTTQRTLLSGIGRLAISYFGSVDQASAPTWHDSWSSADASPDLVSIEVDFPGGDPRYWPRLLAKPPSSIPAKVAE